MKTSLPYSLQRLALDALGRLVFNIMTNRTFPPFVHTSEIKLLSKMIENKVPPNLADLVTVKLFSIVLDILNKRVLHSFFKSYRLEPQVCNQVCSAALNIAIATIHPSTKCFSYNRDYYGLLSLSHFPMITEIYIKNILKLKNLKVLKLRNIEFDNSDILKGLVTPHNLVEFSYNFCSDGILEILSNNCRRLKSLDVRESYKVTDSSVDFILKFRELKFLKINNSKISCQGVTNIMKGIPQGMAGIATEEMKLELNVFKSPFTSLQVNLVPEVYSGLTSVELYLEEECSLLPLCRLRQLRNLGLCRGFGWPNAPDIQFSNAEPLLRLIGGQLWKLKLVDLNGTDLRVVAETCPLLSTLMLNFPNSRQLGFPDKSTVRHYAKFHSLPYFPSIQCLDLKIENHNLIEYLLTRMENLKQIKIWLLYDCTESLLVALVSCFRFRKLEELQVRDYTINLFGNHVVITNVNGLSRERNIKDLEDIIYGIFEGINIFRSPLTRILDRMKNSLPYSLQRLALDALGRLVLNIMANRTFPQFVDTSEIKLLSKMIENKVPPNLADLVTVKLFSIVLDILDKTVVHSSFKGIGFCFNSLCCDGCCIERQRCDEVCSAALNIAIATIHPSTKCFTYNRDYQGLLSLSYVPRIMRIYIKNILKLKNLKVLKLRKIEFDNSDLLKGLVTPHNLVEFSYNFCSDDILEILSNNCRRLKSLDVRESYKVTDSSVDFILKFRELKFLKINNSKISCQGVTNIMKGIPQGMAGIATEEMKLELNVFKSPFTSLQVNLVPEVYSGLTSVELYLEEECSLLPLCRLRQLRNLGLCRGFGLPNAPDIQFSNAEPLLRLIGGQLWKLKLVDLNGTDLRVVAETCPVLRTLNLNFPNSRQLGFPDGSTVRHYAEFHSLPYFPSIECLDLKIRNYNLIEYLLSRMENLKQIKIWLLYDCTESLLVALVSCFRFRKLEELQVRDYTINLFGNHVVITTVNGLSRERNINDLQNIIYGMFEGINIFRSPLTRILNR